MTIAYWCVLIAAIMPIVWAGAAKFGGKSGGRQFDNARPREWLSGLEGWQQRANWAQENAYEAFGPFAAGVIIAHMTGNADQGTINLLALVFTVARILYGILYIMDRSTLRSLVWLVGLGSVVGLFVAAA